MGIFFLENWTLKLYFYLPSNFLYINSRKNSGGTDFFSGIMKILILMIHQWIKKIPWTVCWHVTFDDIFRSTKDPLNLNLFIYFHNEIFARKIVFWLLRFYKLSLQLFNGIYHNTKGLSNWIALSMKLSRGK